ncbi:glycosyltransferase family 9 protein [archaeon]|nr:glycosyltransferase family 9 protein [archaeon]
MELKRDCRSFIGSYACDILKEEGYKDCGECRFYDAYKNRILIIKLGALGDILRATAILPALKERYKGCYIVWLVKENGKELLMNNPYVDKILGYSHDSLLALQQEYFDVLINLDADLPGTALAGTISAGERFGFYHDKDGLPSAFNKAAEYYLKAQLLDAAKKSNRKSTQEMFFEIAEIPYAKQDYILRLKEENIAFGKNFITEHNLINSRIIGIHIGAGGERWPSKAWAKEQVIDLIHLIKKEANAEVILFAGPQDAKEQEEIAQKLAKQGISIALTNPNNTLREFMAVVNECNIIVCGDSLALHTAAALKKRVIALFFCTPPWEIEDYGRITNLTSPLFEQNLFTDIYNLELVNSIKAEEVFNVIKQLLKTL